MIPVPSGVRVWLATDRRSHPQRWRDAVAELVACKTSTRNGSRHYRGHPAQPVDSWPIRWAAAARCWRQASVGTDILPDPDAVISAKSGTPAGFRGSRLGRASVLAKDTINHLKTLSMRLNIGAVQRRDPQAIMELP
jgi:hypothetical protein